MIFWQLNIGVLIHLKWVTVKKKRKKKEKIRKTKDNDIAANVAKLE